MLMTLNFQHERLTPSRRTVASSLLNLRTLERGLAGVGEDTPQTLDVAHHPHTAQQILILEID